MVLTPRCARPDSLRGFSLVELSVVVAIMSVVATFGLEIAANFVNRTSTSVSREKLGAVDAAVAGFFKIYGRLPCPAVLRGGSTTAAYPTDALYGLEDCSTAANHSISLNSGGPGNGLYAGAIPFRTLNLPRSAAFDGFGAKFNYVVTANLTVGGGSATDFGRFGSYGGTPAQNGSGGIEMRTGRLAQPCTGVCQVIADPATTPPSGAAYIIFSNGADQRGATSRMGLLIATCTPATGDKRVDSQNCVLGANATRTNMSVTTIPYNVFFDNRYNPGLNPVSYFDDAIIWRTKAQL